MNSFARLTLALFVILSLAAPRIRAESLPDIRPALLGNHKRSLINLLDANAMMKRGQGDAIVMFSMGVGRLGYGGGMQVYRSTPNSDVLQKELLSRQHQAQFEPAVYGGIRRPAYIDGTVVFAIVDGKPRVRICLIRRSPN